MVLIHLRDASTLDRIPLHNVNLKNKVEAFKLKTEQKIGISAAEQRLVYLGRVLEDSNTLLSYGLADGCTVYIFRRPSAVNEIPNFSDPVKPAQLTELLEKVTSNPIYQSAVKRILQDADAVEQLIVATPALKKDPVALALIKDPELLLQISETANVEKIVEEHPALAQAASNVIASVAKERTTARRLIPQNTGISEESDMEGIDPGLIARAEMIAAQEEGIQERQATRPQQISAMQLALALSQAGVTPQPSTSSQPPAQPQAGSSQPPFQLPSTAITSDFFSQAIASAIASTSQPPSSAQSTSHQAALQQMRDMGITNDNLSLQALAQTGGDVQAALNLIFEGGLE